MHNWNMDWSSVNWVYMMCVKRVSMMYWIFMVNFRSWMV